MLVNIRGETALDLASLYGRIDTVNLLVSHCPELLSANIHKSFSPLHLAARNGHVIVALSIINAGQNINSVVSGGSCELLTTLFCRQTWDQPYTRLQCMARWTW